MITDTDRINWLEEQESKIQFGDSKEIYQSWEVLVEYNGEPPDKTVREAIDERIKLDLRAKIL